MKTAFPEYIEFQTVSTCNSRCRVCPMEWTANTLPNGKMSDRLINAIIDECSEHKATIKKMEPYFNNEPFLDKRYLGVLQRIKKDIGSFVEVSTNASLLSNSLAQTIVEERLIDDFRFSFFGSNKEVYETVMKRMDWDVVTNNIINYSQVWKEKGKPIKSSLVFVYNKTLHGEHEIDAFKEYWSFTQLEYIIWNHLDRVGNNKILLNGANDGKIKNVVNCKMGYTKNRIAIMYNGDVLLCCQDWGRTKIVGNVANSSIKEIWDSPEMNNLYRAIYDKDVVSADLICQKCELATFAG